MIKDLCYYGNPILRKRCREVEEFTPEVKQVIQDLIDTANAHPSYGLAAPQIGYDYRIFVVTYKEADHEGMPVCTENPHAIINPKITILDEKPWVHGEGCLSIPKVYVDVERPWKIRLEYLNENGEKMVEEHEGWMARPILHENDHLNGVLCIDRAPKRHRKDAEPELKKIRIKYN